MFEKARKALEDDRASREHFDKELIGILHNIKSRYEIKLDSVMGKKKANQDKGRRKEPADDWGSTEQQSTNQATSDNWGSTQQQATDQLTSDDWGTSQQQDINQAATDDWGNTQQQSTSQQDDWGTTNQQSADQATDQKGFNQNSNDGWGTATEQNTGRQDDWGSTEQQVTSQDDWGNTQQQDKKNKPSDDWGNSSQQDSKKKPSDGWGNSSQQDNKKKPSDGWGNSTQQDKNKKPSDDWGNSTQQEGGGKKNNKNRGKSEQKPSNNCGTTTQQSNVKKIAENWGTTDQQTSKQVTKPEESSKQPDDDWGATGQQNSGKVAEQTKGDPRSFKDVQSELWSTKLDYRMLKREHDKLIADNVAITSERDNLAKKIERLENDLAHCKNLIRTLKDGCALVEDQAKTFEVRHETVLMSKADLERELIAIKEESSRHITTIHMLQKSNEQISQAFVLSVEAHEQCKKEVENVHREFARKLDSYKMDNLRLVEANSQLRKLIDYLQKKR